jgi:hypothetical protein
MNNPPPNDPKHIWQTQEMDKMTLSPEQIPDRMQRLHNRGRVTNACLAAAFALIAIYYGVQTVGATGVLRAIACALISAGNAYWTYLAVSTSRSYRPSALAPDEPLRTSVRFYRQVLQDGLDRVRNGNRRALRGAIPILIGFGLLVVQPTKEAVQNASAETTLRAFVQNLGLPEWLIAWLPFLLIVAGWAALRLYGRVVSTKWITHEIERVDQMS